MIRYRRRVDLIAAAVEASWNPFFELRCDAPSPELCFASYMLHSLNPGVLHDVEFAPEIKPFIVQHTPYLSAGDTVELHRVPPKRKSEPSASSNFIFYDAWWRAVRQNPSPKPVLEHALTGGRWSFSMPSGAVALDPKRQ